MTNLNAGGNLIYISPGVGKLQTATEICYSRMLGGADTGQMGLVVDHSVGIGNVITADTDFTGATWTATTTTISEVIYSDMYGGTGAQSLTPVATTSNIRCNTSVPVTSPECRKCIFAVDLRADVAHNAKIVADNNATGSETTICAVTTSWKRFYVSAYFDSESGGTLYCSIYPDIDDGTNLVYARAPYANDRYNSDFQFGTTAGTKRGDTISGTMNMNIQAGTFALIFAPSYSVQPIQSGTTGQTLIDAVAYFTESSNPHFYITIDYATAGKLEASFGDDGIGEYNVVQYDLATLNMSRGTYYLLAGTWDGISTVLYANGANVGEDNTYAIVVPQAIFGTTISLSQLGGIVVGIYYFPYKTDDAFHAQLYNELKAMGKVA